MKQLEYPFMKKFWDAPNGLVSCEFCDAYMEVDYETVHYIDGTQAACDACAEKMQEDKE